LASGISRAALRILSSILHITSFE